MQTVLKKVCSTQRLNVEGQKLKIGENPEIHFSQIIQYFHIVIAFKKILSDGPYLVCWEGAGKTSFLVTENEKKIKR